MRFGRLIKAHPDRNRELGRVGGGPDIARGAVRIRNGAGFCGHGEIRRGKRARRPGRRGGFQHVREHIGRGIRRGAVCVRPRKINQPPLGIADRPNHMRLNGNSAVGKRRIRRAELNGRNAVGH